MSTSRRDPSTSGGVEPVLQIAGAAKAFGEVRALRGVDLELCPGEWLGLLGPNGAGKTTLVRAIAGRVLVDAGRLVLFGQTLSVSGEPSRRARRRLGVVPQEIALYPLLSARENLRVWGELHGVGPGEIAERVAWALAWTGLEGRAEEKVEGFSGGMKRRLNLAAGVLHRPEVLLLDEPTVGVDPQSRARIWEMLGELRQQGTSLLLTTHQLDEAQTVCERIVILDHGRVIARGTLDELVAETVGRRRRVSLVLETAFPGPPAGGDDLGSGELGGGKLGAELLGLEDGGRRLVFAMADVGAELAPVLDEVRGRGARVLDVAVEAPSLQAVFLHLTGRELRE